MDSSSCVFQGIRFDIHRVRLPRHPAPAPAPAPGSAPSAIGAATGERGDTSGAEDDGVLRDVAVTQDAAVILPCLDEKHIVMIRNERFAVNQTLWELPAGTIEGNDPPLATAKRELIEEAGYQAGNMTPLTHFYPSPGFSTEHMHAFVAKDLSHVGQQLDANERITVEVVTWHRAMQMIEQQQIIDGKTIAVLLYYQMFMYNKP